MFPLSAGHDVLWSSNSTGCSLMFALALLAISGCSVVAQNVDEYARCTPDTYQACTCTNGTTEIQRCGTSSTWEECACGNEGEGEGATEGEGEGEGAAEGEGSGEGEGEGAAEGEGEGEGSDPPANVCDGEAEGLSFCADACVDTLSDPLHCGLCDLACIDDALCSEGECVAECGQGRTDCDRSCVDLATNARHCGECGVSCVLPHAGYSCVASRCEFGDCDQGWMDADGHPDTGCECELTGDEVCDGADNDCDGTVDEGIDLYSDPGHCGACGTVCAVAAAVPACLGGVCGPGACLAGAFDVDRDPANGCEEEGVSEQVYVDQAVVGPGTGSERDAYKELSTALEALITGQVIIVAAGNYIGPFVVSRSRVVLRAAEGAAPVLSGDGSDSPVLRIEGSYSHVSGFTINAGTVPYGVQLECEQGCTLSECQIMGTRGADANPQGDGHEAVAIQVVSSPGSHVRSNTVSVVRGGLGIRTDNGRGGYAGGRAIGIEVVDSPRTIVVDNTLQQLTGGGAAHCQYAFCHPAAGSEATGVVVLRSPEVRVVANEITVVAAGPGGSSGDLPAGATGGPAYGIAVRESLGVSLVANVLDGITAGAGGTGGHAPGGAGGSVSGIYLGTSPQSTVTANRIRGMTGGQGGEGGWRGPASIAGAGVGITVVGSTEVALDDNSVDGVVGGAGRPGAAGLGVKVSGCERLELTNTRLGDVSGGGTAHCNPDEDAVCIPGPATGVSISASTSVTVDHLLLHDVSGREATGLWWGQGSILGAVGHVTMYGVLGEDAATGVRVHEEASTRVTDSIIVNTNGHGLYNEGRISANLSLSFTTVWGHDGERHVNVERGLGVVDLNPEFLSPVTRDFRLRRRSPAVDAGDPASPCDLEPAAEGADCVADLGFYGNTPRGWSPLR